ncbi:MAG: cytochrome c3 family protein [Candidatus Wallbacteria bacterium]|nr:cytochrome c3 family protein [Candidatus Wallbacteria bacterium]
MSESNSDTPSANQPAQKPQEAAPIAPENKTGNGARRLEAFIWLAIRLLPFALLVGLAMIPVSFHVTSTPGFCNSCHIMEPYYQSWSKSAHKHVECLACHLAPGLAGKIKGKWQALSQLARYVTRTYGTRPWAEVLDANCTACHSHESLQKVVHKGNFKFDHRPHINGSVRDKNLKCTTCHTQLESTTHISVAKQACYLCHFKPTASGELPKMAACTTCHDAPDKKIEFQDSPIAHKDLVARGLQCNACHSGVVDGNGRVLKIRCQSCHADPEKLKAMGEVSKIHKVHVSGKGVYCLRCHNEISHERRPMDLARSRDDCSACHVRMHETNAALYAGTLGGNNAPSPMFTSGIECRACHEVKKGGKPDESACFRCHSARIHHLLDGWRDNLAQGRETLQANVRTIWASVPQRPFTSSTQAAISQANWVASQLQDGAGIHNVQLSRKLMMDANAGLKKAVASLAPTVPLTSMEMEALPDQPDTKCVNCHFTLGKGTVPYLGYPFSHKRHVVENGMQCSQCHKSGEANHGKMIAKLEDCQGCHAFPPGK